MKPTVLAIDGEGRLSFVYDDNLAGFLALGPGRVKRASIVEPDPAHRWRADLSPVGGPTLGPFERRGEAIAREVEWLQENAIGNTSSERTL